MSTLADQLSHLPQDLLRTLQRAADFLDLYIDGLTVDEVVERYTALGCQITRDFAAQVQQEATAARAGYADVAVAQPDERQLVVTGDVHDGSSEHACSVASSPQPLRAHNYALPSALARFATARGKYMLASPQDIEVHGFHVTDVTHTDHTYRTGSLIWLGRDSEGRWLTAVEVLDIAHALRLVALAQMRRVSLEGGAA